MKKLILHCGELSIHDKDIIRIKLFDNIDIEKKDAIEVIQALNTITEGKEYYLLTETGKHFTATGEAREYMAKNICTTSIIANAICLRSLPIRLVINVYVKFNKPTIPTKTFNLEQLALFWIKEQMSEYQLKKVV